MVGQGEGWKCLSQDISCQTHGSGTVPRHLAHGSGSRDSPLRTMALSRLWFAEADSDMLGVEICAQAFLKVTEHLKTHVLTRLPAIFCSVCIQR